MEEAERRIALRRQRIDRSLASQRDPLAENSGASRPNFIDYSLAWRSAKHLKCQPKPLRMVSIAKIC
jgi:hypothetical protein